MTTQSLTREQFLEKIETLRKTAGQDLSTAEDLSFAVMNLVSLEEHFVLTALKTGRDEYFDTAGEVREMRKSLLAELMPKHEGETWCISKHLLATTMRLIEVGNKLRSEGKRERSKKMFDDAYRVYAIFWALKWKLVEGRAVADAAAKSARIDDLLNKLADCCDE